MSKVLAILVGALCFSGIANANANNNYIPILYNLSTILDFNPVKGPIKSLDEHVVANGKEIQEIKLNFDNGFCVENLTINRPTEGYSLELKLKGSVLEGEKNGKPFSIELSKDCNLHTVNDNGDKMEYTLNSNGMIKDTFFLGSKVSEHFYDKESNFVRSVFLFEDKVLSKNEVTYADSHERPLDYKIMNSSGSSDGFIATNSCEYSEQLVPKLCQLTVQKTDSPPSKPTEMTVSTKVEFY
ncbi:YnfC family lipoprotein [Duffyella gerundensis]|uniref:YnfC family lipoprotein n=1 Tax=Duffyella gerundensis TaxID=1619313 RepID=UPI003FD1D694